MRTKNIKVKITIPFPFDRPDENNVVYTKKSVERAVSNLRLNIPIMKEDNCIGVTQGDSHIVEWDYDNKTCYITIDGVIRYGGTNEDTVCIDNGKVTSFEINGLGY